MFHRYASGRVRCKRCVAERVTRRHRRVKQLLEAEAGGCCRVCGYDRHAGNLHFHHVDRATKSYAVNAGNGRSLAALRAEARKCVLVCANCHGEIEAGLIPCPPLPGGADPMPPDESGLAMPPARNPPPA